MPITCNTMQAFLFNSYPWIKTFCFPNYIQHMYTYFWSGTTCIQERTRQRFLHRLLEKWSHAFADIELPPPRGLGFYHVIKYLKFYKILQHRKKNRVEVCFLIHLLVIISCQVWQKDNLSLESLLCWGNW